MAEEMRGGAAGGYAPADEIPSGRRRPGRKLSYGLLPTLIGYNLRRAQLAVFQNFRQVMAELDVTPGQVGVLVLIAENESMSQSQLGRALGIDRSTMVAVIDRLEERGLVRRAPSPTDRRSYALELTSAGEGLLERVWPKLRAHEDAIAADLSEAEQATLVRLLRRVGG